MSLRPMRFAKESWPFVLPFVVLTPVLLWLGYPLGGVGAGTLAVLVLLFFRHPTRSYDGPGEIVLAAADGKVTRVDALEDAAVGPGRFRRVVTFLSVFDVHIQRAPVAGEVIRKDFLTGKKVAAFLPHADQVNENHLTVLKRPGGDVVAVRQIAGLLARRIVSYLEEGDRVERNQTLGLIKFGSRVDLLVPESYEILVKEGARLAAGETPVARPEST